MRCRQAGQEVVEFSLLIVAVALVGMTGLSVLGRAEEGYFIPLQQSLSPTTPVGTDDVVHPTSMTAFSCASTTVVATVTTNLSCSFWLVDTWSDKRTWPQGAVHLLYGATDLGSCTLAPNTTTSDGADSACSGSFPLTPALADVGSKLLAAHYVPSDGKHRAPSPDPTLPITVLLPLQFSPAPVCNNDMISGWGNQVEVGHPIRCSVTVTNPATGTAASGVDVTWTLTSTSAVGQPLLSCATFGNSALFPNTIWNSVPGNGCVPGSPIHCTTNSFGRCSVIYRLARTLMGSTPLAPGLQDVKLSILSGAVSLTVPSMIVIVGPAHAHPAQTWFTCTPVSGNAHVDAPALFTLGMATFQSTQKIEIHGVSGTVSCAPTVIDTDPSPALDCSAGPPPSCVPAQPDPDKMDAHAPVGTVSWQLGGAGFGAPTCSLHRLDLLPPQAPNETPYASNCAAATRLTLSGSVGQETTLTAVMTGSGSQPTHYNAYSLAAQVEFK